MAMLGLVKGVAALRGLGRRGCTRPVAAHDETRSVFLATILQPRAGPLSALGKYGLEDSSRGAHQVVTVTRRRLRQVRSPGRAAQSGTGARRPGSGRTGARGTCRRRRGGDASGPCKAAAAGATAASFAYASTPAFGTTGRSHTSPAEQWAEGDRGGGCARGRAGRGGCDLGSL